MPYVTVRESASRPPLSLHYRIAGDAAGVHTLVCLHELGGSLESLHAFGGMLAPSCRVVTFDQRCAGLSEHPVAPFTLDDLADDVDRLVGELGISPPFHLMGLAMGAVTALRYAVRRSERLASLVLCDGTGEITSDAKRYILDRAARVRAEGMQVVADVSFSNAFRGLADAAARWPDYRHRFLANPPASYAMHSQALAEARFSDAELARIHCPTLVLNGRHDFIWPPEVGQRLAARIQDARFAPVEDAAHFPPVQCPGRVAAMISEFINRQV